MMTPSDTAPPNDPPTTEEPSQATTSEATTSEATPTEEVKPEPAALAVDPLEAPLPQEWTVPELISKKREDKGVLYACAFACCCCFLCYEKLEFVLDFVCCKTCK
ncbi:unnamed protein product [Calypogeia fissa]